MNELTKEWVDKAEEDFNSAEVLLHAGEVPLPSPA
jgi:HEPN domain-containing protein